MADNTMVRECYVVTTQTTSFRCSDDTCQSMHSRRVLLTTVSPPPPHTHTSINRYVTVYRDITETLCTIFTCGYLINDAGKSPRFRNSQVRNFATVFCGYGDYSVNRRRLFIVSVSWHSCSHRECKQSYFGIDAGASPLRRVMDE